MFSPCLFGLLVLVTGLASSTPRCKSFDDPKNGYVTCDSLFHLFCSPECHPGYRFAAKPAVVYMCGPVTGEWFTYPVGSTIPWPDCIPDNSDGFDSIKHELTQKREAISKRITDRHTGIPTSPYTATGDPEDRFHHLFDYIEKAQRAYQYREVIEKEAQALQREHDNHSSGYIAGMQTDRPYTTSTTKTTLEVHNQVSPMSPTPVTLYGTSFSPNQDEIQPQGAVPPSSSVLTPPSNTLAKSFRLDHHQNNYEGESIMSPGLSSTRGAAYGRYSARTRNTPITHPATSFAFSNFKGVHTSDKAISPAPYGTGAQVRVYPQTSSKVTAKAAQNQLNYKSSFPKIPNAVPSDVRANPSYLPDRKTWNPALKTFRQNQPNYQNTGPKNSVAVSGVMKVGSQNRSNGKTWKLAASTAGLNQPNYQNIGLKNSGVVRASLQMNLSNRKTWNSGSPTPGQFRKVTAAKPVRLSSEDSWRATVLDNKEKVSNQSYKSPDTTTEAQVFPKSQEIPNGNIWKPLVLPKPTGNRNLEIRTKAVARKIIPPGSKNILKLLTNGANKDLGNMDLHAHLRPLRETQSNSRKNLKYATSIKQSIQTVKNINIEEDTNNVKKTLQSRTDNDIMEHVEPIIMTSSTVLNSIASLVTKKSQPKDSQTPVTSTLKPQDGIVGHSLQGKARNNVSSQIKDIEENNQFQSWLTRKKVGKQINPQPPTANPDSRVNGVIAKQQDHLLRSQLHNLKQAQETTQGKFEKYPGTNQSPLARMTSSMNGRVKEHVFYFPVKKNTLLDILKEKIQNK